MWAATTLSCRLWHPPTATTTGDGKQTLFTVFARYSRPRKKVNYDYEEEEEEERETYTLKQQQMGHSDDASVPNLEDQEKIRGSVVLLALQKASAQKTSKKMKKKKKKEVEDKRRIQEDASTDYSAVKPLCIKTDWKDRLDVLETQLYQLMHNA